MGTETDYNHPVFIFRSNKERLNDFAYAQEYRSAGERFSIRNGRPWEHDLQRDCFGRSVRQLFSPYAVDRFVRANDVLGSTGKSAAGVIDRDYFTFTVAPGLELTGLTVLPGTQTLGPLGDSFIGVESGPAFTVNPATAIDATGLSAGTTTAPMILV
jgi:hypothetical protein